VPGLVNAAVGIALLAAIALMRWRQRPAAA